MVRFVRLRLKRGAVRWWSCSRDTFVQLNVSLVWNWCLFDHDNDFEFDYFWAKSTLCGCDCIPCGHVWLGDSTGAVHHVEIEMESSAMVELLKRHIRTVERITDMKLISRSNMTIILCSTIFEPSQHSVAVTVYHVVIYVQAIDLLWYQFKFIPHVGCVNVVLRPFFEWLMGLIWWVSSTNVLVLHKTYTLSWD